VTPKPLLKGSFTSVKKSTWIGALQITLGDMKSACAPVCIDGGEAARRRPNSQQHGLGLGATPLLMQESPSSRSNASDLSLRTEYHLDACTASIAVAPAGMMPNRMPEICIVGR
jgi:hypothetical protein